MKKRSKAAWLGLLLLLVAAGFLVVPKDDIIGDGGPIELKLLSFNIRQGRADDGDNHWSLRKDLVGELIRRDLPDVLGVQEAYRFQLDEIRAGIPEYREAGSGRDGGDQGEYSAILFRKDRFKLIDSDTFWLSETPHEPSAHWGNHYHRICTWVRLRDRRSGRYFYVYNTHMDHQSQPAREQGVRLIMRTIAARPTPDPFILMGDLNAGEQNNVIRYLKGEPVLDEPSPIAMRDSWRVVHSHDRDCGTISRFTGSREPYKIDYILVPPQAQVLAAEILREHHEGRYPSDHYPISARVRFE